MISALPGARNPGMALDLEWVSKARVHQSAVEQRAALVRGHAVKDGLQATSLLRAVRCLDLTSLSGDETPESIRALCAKAQQPVGADLLAALGASDSGIQV